MRLIVTIFAVLMTFAGSLSAQITGESYALLIGGLGGSEEFSRVFQTYLIETKKALIGNHNFQPENIIVLAEKANDTNKFDGVSRAVEIKEQFRILSDKVKKNDRLFVMLFGHGSYDQTGAKLNIPRADLSDRDFAGLIATLQASTIVVVNTASSSSPFIENISAPGRIVITATKSPGQRNVTTFPKYFVEGLSSSAADRDKNSQLSLFELFAYASENTERSFTAGNNLPTEHALLDDNGDGAGLQYKEINLEDEGSLASTTYFDDSPLMALALREGPAGGEMVALISQKVDLEQQIAELKRIKAELVEDEYYSRLEVLFVRLAKVMESIEVKEEIR